MVLVKLLHFESKCYYHRINYEIKLFAIIETRNYELRYPKVHFRIRQTSVISILRQI